MPSIRDSLIAARQRAEENLRLRREAQAEVERVFKAAQKERIREWFEKRFPEVVEQHFLVGRSDVDDLEMVIPFEFEATWVEEVVRTYSEITYCSASSDIEDGEDAVLELRFTLTDFEE
jgi:hypothetical protein